MRICVAKHAPTVGLLMHAALEGCGNEVTVDGDGIIAREEFQNTTHDLVLLDVDMPVVIGYEVCKEIKDILEFHFIQWMRCFATDYSPMQTLNKLRLWKIKSDRFIAPEIPILKTDQEMVHAKGSVASALGISVKADKFETEAQCLELSQFVMQPHLRFFCRPI